LNCPSLIISICCHCGKEYGRKDGRGASGTSHGSCPACHEKVMNELGVSMAERQAIYMEVAA